MKYFISLLIAFYLFFTSSGSRIVYAQQAAMSIIPVEYKTIAQPGSILSLPHTLQNTGDPLTLRIDIHSFLPSSSNGEMIIQDLSGPISFALTSSDIQLGTDTILKSQEQKNITLLATIPTSLLEKDYYYVVTVTSVPPPMGDSTSVRSSITVTAPLLITISKNGTIDMKATTRSLTINPHGTLDLLGVKTTFVDSTYPLFIDYIIDNSGKNYLITQGNVQLVPFIGGKTEYPLNNTVILAHSSRLIHSDMNEANHTLKLKDPLFGKYSLAVRANFGTNSPLLITSTTFIAAPFTFMLFLVSVAVLLYTIARYLAKRQSQISEYIPYKETTV